MEHIKLIFEAAIWIDNVILLLLVTYFVYKIAKWYIRKD